MSVNFGRLRWHQGFLIILAGWSAIDEAPDKYIDKIHVSQFSLGCVVHVRTDNGRILIVRGHCQDSGEICLAKYDGNISSQD